MSNTIRVAAKLLMAVLLLGLAFFCVFGFLASFEPGHGTFPNVFHALYCVTGLAAIIGGCWLLISAIKCMIRA